MNITNTNTNEDNFVCIKHSGIAALPLVRYMHRVSLKNAQEKQTNN